MLNGQALAVNRRRALLMGAGVALSTTSLMGHGFAQDKQRLSIATGGTGGVFYPYGGGLAKILSERAANMQVTAEVTGGSVDNIKLIGAGEADIGFSTIDSAYDGLQGQGAYTDVGPQPVRTIAVLYDSFLHVVASGGSGITAVAGMKGRSISVGSAGSSTESIADRILEAAGLDPKADITRDNLGVAESVAALKDGKVDAFFWIGGLPTAAVKDLVTTPGTTVTFLETGSLVPALEAKYPGLYRPFVLPKDVYAGVPADVPGLGVANVLVVNAETPAETVTAMLAGIFDNLAEVQQIHPEAGKLSLAGAASRTAVPFHDAAIAFYRERGVYTE